ncbi:outer membrane protein transport protein [Granulosicoccaceae sp. 1_MG-2023]|nr:outer membrane protein transport protein [Granulosicoccaceae sp. 1_MG-2023]
MDLRLTGWSGGVIALGAAFAQPALAAGFAINEQSAIGTGVSLAGAAAGYDDASASWYNPAAMTRLRQRTVTAGVALIQADGDFDDRGSSTNPLLGDNDIEGSTGGFSTTAPIPGFFYTAPLNDQLHYGLAITPTFGLATQYDDDWTGRYSALDSELTSITIAPSLAYAWNDKLSVGGGINLQYLKASLSNALDTGAICLGQAADNEARAACLSAGYLPANADTDSSVTVEGDSWALGFNAGLLYELNTGTRFGVAYHSEVVHDLDGEADFTQSAQMQALLGSNADGLFTDTDASAETSMPASLSLSVIHDLRPDLSLLADITHIWWSSFDRLTVSFDNPAQADSISTYNWDDVQRYSVGLEYRHNAQWHWRAGYALDQSPVPDAQLRTPRIPDGDRQWLSFGGSYIRDEALRVDAAVAFIMSDEIAIDHSEENTGHTVRGIFDLSATIVGATLTWSFN